MELVKLDKLISGASEQRVRLKSGEYKFKLTEQDVELVLIEYKDGRCDLLFLNDQGEARFTLPDEAEVGFKRKKFKEETR